MPEEILLGQPKEVNANTGFYKFFAVQIIIFKFKIVLPRFKLTHIMYSTLTSAVCWHRKLIYRQIPVHVYFDTCYNLIPCPLPCNMKMSLRGETCCMTRVSSNMSRHVNTLKHI